MTRSVLLLTIAISPLLLGSNRPFFWVLNGALVSVMLGGLALDVFCARQGAGRYMKALFLAAAGLILVLSWMWIQAAGFTPASWDHPIWLIASPIGSNGSVSIEPSLTLSTIGWTATLSITLVAIVNGADRRFVLKFMKTAAATAAAVALFGLVVDQLGIKTLGIVPKTEYLNSLTGTFVNRNSAATFFGFGMISALVSAREQRRGPAASHELRRLPGSSNGALWWLFTAIFLFFAVVMTGSRGGTISVVIGLAVFFALLAWKARRMNSLGTTAAVGLAAICVLAVSAFFGIGVFDRPDGTHSARVRMSLYREAVHAIADRVLLGHGAGAYSAVEPLYQSSATPENFIWDHVHSTYLEAALTLGIPAATLILGAVVAVLAWIGRLMVRRRCLDPAVLAALPVTAIAAVHSLVDFSLQMQANALYFATFAGLAVGATAGCDIAEDLSPGAAHRPNTPAARTWPRHAAVGLIVLLASVTLISNLRIAIVEFAVPPNLWLSVSSIRRYIPQLSGVGPATTLGISVGRFWNDPFAIYSHAVDCQRLEVLDPNVALPPSRQRLQKCLVEIDAALRLAPATGLFWLKRAALLKEIEGPSAAFSAALRNVYKTARHVTTLRPTRVAMALPSWKSLPVDLRKEVAQEITGPGRESTMSALAKAYVRYPAERVAIDLALAEATNEETRQHFLWLVQIQGDRFRRYQDRRTTAKASASCRTECAATSVLTFFATGEAFEGPPEFRLWIDGRARPIETVSTASDRKDLTVSARPEVFEFLVPKRFMAVEVEFINDRWDPARGFDRNLLITGAKIDGYNVPITCFGVPVGYEKGISIDQKAVHFFQNGPARLEHACIDSSVQTLH